MEDHVVDREAAVSARPAVRLDDMLIAGTVLTAPDGQMRAADLSLDEHVLLEERDLVDPAGRVRVERLDAGPLRWGPASVTSLPLFTGAGSECLLGWLLSVSVDGLTPSPATVRALAGTLAEVMADRRVTVAADNETLRAAWAQLCAGPGDASLLGWDVDQPLIVLAVALDPVHGGRRQPDLVARERLAEAWRSELDHCGAPARLIDLDELLMAVLPVSLVPSVDELVAGVAIGRPFSVGVSRVVAGVGDLGEAAREAERALAVGRDRGGAVTTYFQRLGVDRLLALVPASDAAAYASDMLGPLAADTSEAADLRRTLQLLLDTDWNIAEAARLQYLHYMTVRFRVTKFERWLGPLADDPARRLDVAVALRILGAWTSPTSSPTSVR
ncbi:PucR family transcriptional regulator [Nocardioides sp. Kera G14]|uniref:PucR family transcriptional regulator n=1 Tax=Nocardioides sp. Kera G14 TaxID=2884264 RepID=UPI001D0FDAF6|nr:helix-turn-helix domain-containing protein [Nocardioides sp. Kera G14]UDY24567.1 helix-turn-helix domain-containing protein [Nocardioides sp. Kera G14]